MLEVNIPEVIAEMRAAFDRYNRAVDDNDVAVMNEMFWDSPHTVRYGRAENLYGHAEIAAYRTMRKTNIERSYPRTVITRPRFRDRLDRDTHQRLGRARPA